MHSVDINWMPWPRLDVELASVRISHLIAEHGHIILN